MNSEILEAIKRHHDTGQQKNVYPDFYLKIEENLLEKVKYNTPTTPIKAAISHLSDFTGGIMPPHWHKELECIVVLEGKLHYYINNQTYHLSSGQGLVVNTNRIHQGGPALSEFPTKDIPVVISKNNDCAYVVVILQPDTLRFNRKMEEKYINPLLYDKNSDVLYFDGSQSWHDEAIERILTIFQAVAEKKPCFELTAQSQFFSLWSLLYSNTIAKNGFDYAQTDPMKPLKKMLSYIHEHYQQAITLHDIAQSGMMCESKCCRLFRDILRQSPIAYLTAYRIQKGIDLLDHTDLNITEIALECGFHGASYFTETFRKMHGISPKEYRKK